MSCGSSTLPGVVEETKGGQSPDVSCVYSPVEAQDLSTGQLCPPAECFVLLRHHTWVLATSL